MAGLFICSLLGGCGTPGNGADTTTQPQPTPTIAAFFSDATAKPIATQSSSTNTPIATPQSGALPSATPSNDTPLPITRTPDKIEVISLYDDKLNPNWSLENSELMRYSIASKTTAQQGQVSIEAQPTRGQGKLFFTVKKSARDTYERKRVLGVRFWLSGGNHVIATSDLAVAIIGSNRYSYWVENDTSVQINATVTPDAPLFSETRLYYLNINRNIPPETWVEVIIWLDSLRYDPEYTYVTGLYIKNDELFNENFYLDHIDLLLQPKS